MTREEAMKAIAAIAAEFKIPYILFDDDASMKELMRDMRYGSHMRRALGEQGVKFEFDDRLN